MTTATPQRKSLFAKAVVVRPESFPLRVDGYDTKSAIHTVTGTRLDTGAVVSVSLRDIDYKSKGKFGRPTIEKFSAERKTLNDPGTVPGGVLLIEEGIQAATGVYSARWIRSLSHSPQEGEVMMVTAHVTPVKTSPGGKDYSILTFLHDGNIDHLSQDMVDALRLTASGKVSSMDELRTALTEMVSDNIGAGVRIKVGDDFDGLYVAPKKGATPEKSVSDFMDRMPDEVCAAIESGEALCEVIPYGNAWAGPATLGVMTDSATVMSKISRYNDEVVGDDGKARVVQLFRPSIVALRLTAPDTDGKRSAYFTHFEPTYSREPVVGLREAIIYASTAEFSPEPPKPELGRREVSPAPNASAPGTGTTPASTSFDAGGAHESHTDDDVMGAASDEGPEHGQASSVDAGAEVEEPKIVRGRRAPY